MWQKTVTSCLWRWENQDTSYNVPHAGSLKPCTLLSLSVHLSNRLLQAGRDRGSRRAAPEASRSLRIEDSVRTLLSWQTTAPARSPPPLPHRPDRMWVLQMYTQVLSFTCLLFFYRSKPLYHLSLSFISLKGEAEPVWLSISPFILF